MNEWLVKMRKSETRKPMTFADVCFDCYSTHTHTHTHTHTGFQAYVSLRRYTAAAQYTPPTWRRSNHCKRNGATAAHVQTKWWHSAFKLDARLTTSDARIDSRPDDRMRRPVFSCPVIMVTCRMTTSMVVVLWSNSGRIFSLSTFLLRLVFIHVRLRCHLPSVCRYIHEMTVMSFPPQYL